MIKEGVEYFALRSKKRINSIWKKGELSEWKESITVPIYKKCIKTDRSNNRGISIFSTLYKITPNILLSRLSPHAEDIIGNHQCGFRCHRPTTDHILRIRQILEKKWEYNEAVHQLFTHFKKAYDSVRREVLYNILVEFGITMKQVSLIKMYLNGTYSKVRVGKHLSDMFTIKNILKKRDALWPLIFNFALEYAIKRTDVNQDGLKLNGTHQLLVYADDVNILSGSLHTTKKKHRRCSSC